MDIKPFGLYRITVTARFTGPKDENEASRIFPYPEGYGVAVFSDRRHKNVSDDPLERDFTPFYIQAPANGKLRINLQKFDKADDAQNIVQLKIEQVSDNTYYFDPTIQRFRTDILTFGGVPKTKNHYGYRRYYASTRYDLWDLPQQLSDPSTATNSATSAFGASTSPLAGYPFANDGTRYLYYQFENREGERSDVCSPIIVDLPKAGCSLEPVGLETTTEDLGSGPQTVYLAKNREVSFTLKGHGPKGTDGNTTYAFLRSFTYNNPTETPQYKTGNTYQDLSLSKEGIYYYSDNVALTTTSDKLSEDTFTFRLPYDPNNNVNNYYVLFCAVSSQESPTDSSVNEDQYYCFNDPDYYSQMPDYDCSTPTQQLNPVTPYVIVKVEGATSFPTFKVQGAIKEKTGAGANSCGVVQKIGGGEFSLFPELSRLWPT